jgi:hypothetical protein
MMSFTGSTRAGIANRAEGGSRNGQARQRWSWAARAPNLIVLPLTLTFPRR